MTFTLFDSDKYLKKSKIDFSRLTIDEFDAFTTLFYKFIYWSQHFDGNFHNNHVCYEIDAFYIGELEVNRVSRDFYFRLDYDAKEKDNIESCVFAPQLILELLYNTIVENDKEKRIAIIDNLYKNNDEKYKEDLQMLNEIAYELFDEERHKLENTNGKTFDLLLSKIFYDFKGSEVPEILISY